MNIVIKNQNYRIIDLLNTEIIKTLTGEFTIEEVSAELVNFFYNKVIIDITAIKNFYDVNSVVTFLRGFETEKIIILLNESEVLNSQSFLGHLVEHGYYNFTRNAAGITFLLDNPNNYEKVAHYTKEIVEPKIEERKPYTEEIKKVEEESFSKGNLEQRIIGIQNLSEHAGATTLAYMMIKQLKINYLAKGIEMNKQDFIYFRDSDLALCTSIDDLKLKLREFANVDAIIIDLNDFDGEEYCDEIIYLLEPGMIRLNKLLKKDSNIVEKSKNGRVILNRSAIKDEEISAFEYETKFKIFYNMPNFNDRKDRIQVVDGLLYDLGFKKQDPNKKGIF